MTIRQQLAAAAALVCIVPAIGCAPKHATLQDEPETRVDTAHFLKGRNGKIMHTEDRVVREITEMVPSHQQVIPNNGSQAYVSIPVGPKDSCGRQKTKKVPVSGLTQQSAPQVERKIKETVIPGGDVVSSISYQDADGTHSGMRGILKNPTPEGGINTAEVATVVTTPSGYQDFMKATGEVIKVGLSASYIKLDGYEGDKTTTNNNNAAAGGAGGKGGTGGTGGAGGNSQSSAKTAPVTATGGSSSSSSKTGPVTATGGEGGKSISNANAETGPITNSADAKTGPVVATGGTANNEGVKAISGSQANNGGVMIDNADKTVNNLNAVNKNDVKQVAVQDTDVKQKATNIGGDTTNVLKGGDTKVVTPVDVDVDTKVVTPTRPDDNGGNGGCKSGSSCNQDKGNHYGQQTNGKVSALTLE